MPTHVSLATPPLPGAVAILDVTGDDVPAMLSRVTGVGLWPPGRLRLVDFSGIDEGLAVLLHPRHAQLMPHAGPRVVQRLVSLLLASGAIPAPMPVGDSLEEQAADAIARAASPAAIDLLLAQLRLWNAWRASDPATRPAPATLLAHADRLDRLVVPPAVVVVGRPNVGKSTLTNAVVGRGASVVADLPGTTRDFVVTLAEVDGVALRWFDTPGVRATPDAIESRAIQLARATLAAADVLIALRDGDHDWPDPADLPRKPDLFAISKCDRAGLDLPALPQGAIRFSAHGGWGVDALLAAVLDKLGLSRAGRAEVPWAFSPSLRAELRGE